MCNSHDVHGRAPEELMFADIVETVIPQLRKELAELYKPYEKDWVFCNSRDNYKARNILEVAKAICGNLNNMTGYELNNAVKILREEMYLAQVAIHNFEDKIKKK